MNLPDTLGWTATVLFSVMLVPQIIKTVRSRCIDGVSLFLYVIYLIANVIALWYAILINQNPLIIKYVIAIITTIFYITLYIRIKTNHANSLQ